MALYLFQSWPFTFSGILLIYLHVSLVYIHKSAVLESCTLLAVASDFTKKGHMMVTTLIPLNFDTVDFMLTQLIQGTLYLLVGDINISNESLTCRRFAKSVESLGTRT